jgi:serine/threonine protein kinase
VVLVGPEPTVLLTQYGVDRILARWTASRRRKGAVLRNHSVYQAPEQVHGETTERADIYAFGAILYEMLAGSFPRTGIASIRRGHLESLAKRRPGITPSLARIISRALHLKPERRPDIAVLCDDLRAELGTNGQPKQLRRRPVESRWATARRTSLVGGGLIIALGLAIWVTHEHLVPQDTRWALPWSLFAPANSSVLDDASRALIAPTPAAPLASPSPSASPSAVASPPVESSPPPRADAVTTAPTSPEQSSDPRGEEKAPPPSAPPQATARPTPPAPRVDARSEPATARPRGALPAPRPSAPNPPEPARTPRETSEDPGAVIDWLLKGGYQRRAP